MVFLLGMAAGLVAARSGLVGVAINATAIAARGYEYNAEKDCIIVRQVTILSDKISYTVGFVNCFLRVPAVYLPCCPAAKAGWGISQKKVCTISMYSGFK